MAQDRVEAVERALTVLETFDSSQEAFSLAELAQTTGFYKSTLLRLLGSLARFGYVQRSADGRWQLGPTPLRLARRHPPSRHLAARVQPLLKQLTIETGETAALLEAQGNRVEVRLAALPDTALRHDLHPGSRWWLRDAENPCPELLGGTMIVRRLASSPGEPLRWLALSGPAGRLSPERASVALAAAEQALAARPTETPTAETAS
ncbi:helix-turn-helix domain-containing protein [Billgrantia gudaonensis]|uniref:Transcriptional regulator, IclR family n=1 Tax=Billgrantia gudaonensis TaxID=376427 RepID=A0A1G8V6E1_9GAMM|nr:helix-turn-helix domain-containing protein [Halomonas gudaonensis]SDJ61437.1 transcriptional regulator, IclR family [Halomonas gudaonensis]